MNWAAGIDIGGTNVKAVAVDAAGAVLARRTTETADGVATVKEWIEAARAALEEFEQQCGSGLVAVGICAPGLAAADGRSIAHLPGKLRGLEGVDWTRGLGWDGRAVVPVLNDGHAALVGEAWCGAAKGKRDVVMLTLGTGVGGAVMCDGRLLRGARGRAGHIGHMSLDPEGPVSITGMAGALEVFLGDCTVRERSGGRFASTAALVAAQQAGDAEATRVWLKSIRVLGTAVASCVNLFDPAVVVLGGGIAQAGAALFEPLAREMARVEWRLDGHGVPVVPAQLGEWAGAIGAARNAWQKLS